MSKSMSLLGICYFTITLSSAGMAQQALVELGSELLAQKIEGISEPVKIYAAPGYVDLAAAQKIAQPAAEAICKLQGYERVIELIIDKDKTFPVTPYNADDIYPYTVFRPDSITDTAGLKVEFLQLSTKWVFNNPLEVLSSGYVNEDMDLWETHHVPNWTFSSIKCFKSN